MLDGGRISGNKPTESKFTCGPAEGSPIISTGGEKNWFSSIQCWLQSVLPATISGGSCGAGTLGLPSDSASAEANPADQEDANKNGIPDGAERLANLAFTAEKTRNAYGTTVDLAIKTLDSSDKITDDSFSQVRVDIVRASVLRNGKTQVVYDADTETLSDTGSLSDLVNFSPTVLRAQSGIAKYALSTKSTDADVVLRASVQTKDRQGKTVVDVISDDLTLQIR